jgi:MoaA/NifB/PqqE/SkfB family radical SAM enzyme
VPRGIDRNPAKVSILAISHAALTERLAADRAQNLVPSIRRPHGASITDGHRALESRRAKMRRFTQEWKAGAVVTALNNFRRRREWFVDGISARQASNLLLAGTHFALRREVVRSWPVLVKVDISPLCNLRCTYCVHASPGQDDALLSQVFRGHQMMSVERFERIAREIGGRSAAVALYYVGDPLMHPDLSAICAVAARFRLNSHVSTNFSFGLSDDQLSALVASGLSHLTVCVDGMTQEHYDRTRVGGRIDRVLDNLDRLLAIRRELGRRLPKVEVQYIKYQHNLDEIEDAARWAGERGVDQFTDYWGNLYNYADIAPERYDVLGPKRPSGLPLCAWPHFAMQIKWDGDVLPCCYHRVAEQYRPDGDSRPIGNVFTTSVAEVWNSPAYRNLRRLVADPRRSTTEPELGGTFCEGCPAVFDTTSTAEERTGERWPWEALYERDQRRRVQRRPVVQAASLPAPFDSPATSPAGEAS